MRKANIAVVGGVGTLFAFLYYKYGRKGSSMMYEFPNGFNDLENWKLADDGSNSKENRKTKFMIAIAKAEGYGVPGAIPTRANNPGDLTRSLGFSTTGERLGSAAIVVFSDAANGWSALERQLTLIETGQSIHKLSDTILAFAHSYTATEQDVWAANVAAEIGLDPNATLGDYLA